MIVRTRNSDIPHVKRTEDGRTDRRILDITAYTLFQSGNNIIPNNGHTSLYRPLQG
jgi:hypothetical protein